MHIENERERLNAVRALAKVPITIPTYPDKTEVAQPTMKAMTVNIALIHESDTPNTIRIKIENPTTKMAIARYSANKNS